MSCADTPINPQNAPEVAVDLDRGGHRGVPEQSAYHLHLVESEVVAASFVRPRTPARRPVSATSYAALHAAADEVSEGALDARRAGHHASVAPQPIMNRDVDEAMSGHGFVRTASGREPGAAVQSVTAVVALGWGADP